MKHNSKLKIIIKNSKNILVAPLDWGLGHTTRCIPIIRELLDQGAKVSLASSGRAGTLLQAEFPGLPYVGLPAYKIRYAFHNMNWNMALQCPKILRTVLAEKFQIKKLVKKQKFDAIISDNRFGCFHPNIKSVFITHQLHIRIPNPVLRRLLAWVNNYAVLQFDECWVPDQNHPDNLAGALSFPPVHPNTQYLGLLSRMRSQNLANRYDFVAILSGPEPQRSKLESMLISQLMALPLKSLIIQGKTEKKEKIQISKNLEMISYLKAEGLNQVVASSKYIICRSGYSSIMDLARLGKKALLVPTPGQTEQEYLADQLFQKGICFQQNQAKLNIKEALEKIDQFTGFGKKLDHQSQLQTVIQKFLASL